ncbi:MAG: menaquinone biosynthesis protein [Euryarchaeota archaeon]|jgi:chorismate dehydratase|nr:menaquinone biosynthesis protein [Euryarchaeota archaeon]
MKSGTDLLWANTIGRVAFMNCDPLFLGLDPKFNVLPAPPSWLTGHLLRRDCVLAPIPAADFARHHQELILIPEIGISSKGEVGSVLVFGNRPVEEMRDIAMPSDSASSVALLKYLLKVRGLDPRPVEMGPDLDSMLDRCDGALLIGDRALDRAKSNPELVQLDLGQAWLDHSNHPMVFGVFAARKDTPIDFVKRAHSALIERLELFENDPLTREQVILNAHQQSDMSIERMNRYFGEVFNRLDEEHVSGLQAYLTLCCGMTEELEFMW